MAKVKNTLKTQDFDAIRISIASPDEILDWSYGEVSKPETINYRTQKPERDGLFCEKIFGPSKDYECYCGKYKKIRYKGVVCDKCGVEVTRSSVRRERMGHISLAVPVAHIWYVRSVPSRMAIILDISPKDVGRIIYFAEYIILGVDQGIRESALKAIEKEYLDFKSQLKDPSTPKNAEIPEQKEKIEKAYMAAKAELSSLELKKLISESRYLDLSMKYGQIVKVGIGAEAIYELLKDIDLEKEASELKDQLKGKDRLQIQSKKLVKRLKIINGFLEAGIRPEWMILRVMPVIPPDLRPMVQLDGGRFATADLNDLYRRIINRNNRLKKLLEQNSPEVICRNEKRMLQEAVDALIDSAARRDKGMVQRRTRKELKSLSDMLRGKEGRFRQNLLGKRVDYSGRSVIVVGPELKLNQCGLPKEMALELFKPFVIGRLIAQGFAHNVKNASAIIERKELVIWDILEEITSSHLVLLNRAPTLHRLGIQAFQPVLIEGKAIQIHPLVCSAYNADFDGDQMAVYIPLSKASLEEAEKLMLSNLNILKPATGDPIVTPSCDIVLGCYYLTYEKPKARGEGKSFRSKEEALLAYRSKTIELQAKIKSRIDGELIETTPGRIIFNEVFPKPFPFVNQTLDKKALRKTISKFFREFGNLATAELVDGIKDLGFTFASQSGITFAIEDIKIPEKKRELLNAAREEVEKISNQYFKGLISERERYEKLVELWGRVKTKVENAMVKNFSEDNPIYKMVASGARGSTAQLVQVAGMKGQVANPAGEIIEFPVESNYREGFDEFEYFISSHGARKGRTDTALKTADAGYLTRRLVDVAQDVAITSKDCGTKCGIVFSKTAARKDGRDFTMQITGRILAKDIKIKGDTLYKKGTEIDSVTAHRIVENDRITEVETYSVLTCKNLWGTCQKCYGIDLSKGKLVELGTAVGIIAAQAIGEPGTQLTLRTFHIGGVVGEDITQGLPRVEELFEARSPKSPAKISEISGTVDIEKEEDIIQIKIGSDEYRKEEETLPEGWKFQVKSGDKVKARQIVALSKNKRALRAKFPAQVKIEKNKIIFQGTEKVSKTYELPAGTNLKVKEGDKVSRGTELSEGHRNLEEMYQFLGQRAVEDYLVREIQYIYSLQGVGISDKHIELIVGQMFSRVRIKEPGDTKYLEGQLVDCLGVEEENTKMKKLKKKEASFERLILGISRVALSSESFLSAASFQETTSVLIEAATTGAVDGLRGLKENVIIGRLIPAGSGFRDSK